MYFFKCSSCIQKVVNPFKIDNVQCGFFKMSNAFKIVQKVVNPFKVDNVENCTCVQKIKMCISKNV